MSGLDLKKAVDSDITLRHKSIPFIFATSTPVKREIIQAYEYHVQVFFQKPTTIEEQTDMLDIIIKYWIVSCHPNNDPDDHATRQTIAERTTPLG